MLSIKDSFPGMTAVDSCPGNENRVSSPPGPAARLVVSNRLPADGELGDSHHPSTRVVDSRSSQNVATRRIDQAIRAINEMLDPTRNDSGR